MYFNKRKQRNRILLTLTLAICSVALAAAPKPNAQMKSILDDLQSKNGKSIETLTA